MSTTEPDKISLTINGISVNAREGATILEVARDNGIYIPSLCYQKDLPPSGSCRLCVVEVEGSRTLVGSCHTPVSKNMIVKTDTPKVKAARRTIVELMMASHPDNCLVCEKANRCELRQIAADLDIGLPRFKLKKHFYQVEEENANIIRDMSKCILCRRCVVVCKNISGKQLFSIGYRAFNSKVIYGLDETMGRSEICGDCDACVYVCPTGALRKHERMGEKSGQVRFIKG